MAKLTITIKAPDNDFYDRVVRAATDSLGINHDDYEDHVLTDKQVELVDARAQEYWKLLRKWVDGEYVTIEIDTVTGECQVVPTRARR